MFAPTVPPPEGATVALRDGYRGDRFYVSPDGRYIGDDGFRVPADFEEFHVRWPNYVRNWVKKRLYSRAPEEDVEDWSQDLLIHLQFLPAESKHREAGKTDIIQTFDPFQQYGASERRFRNYINFCLLNKFRTVGGKHSRNPLSHAGNVSIVPGEPGDAQHAAEGTDEYVYQHSHGLSQASQREFSAQESRLLASEFMDFVRLADPEVAPLLEAVRDAGGSFSDARRMWCCTCGALASALEVGRGRHGGHEVGMDPRRFGRFRARVKELAAKFVDE